MIVTYDVIKVEGSNPNSYIEVGLKPFVDLFTKSRYATLYEITDFLFLRDF